jgi:phage tail sheath protein FI
VPVGLDPRNPDDLREIVLRQQQVVDVARAHQRFVALLDVPDGVSPAQVTDWRAGFDSSYAAAYHPWLAVAPGPGDAVAVPPSAFAAGIVAARENRLGQPWGPANELARDVVRAEAEVTDAIHDRLHQLGVNVFRRERDGFRLTAGRTLSSDPDYRQLSVRRLMTMLRLAIERQTQWLAFEPNDAELRERLSRVVTGFLRTMNRRGAFAGATEAESFFVRCGDDVNPVASQALGRLVAEIGVAPAVPLEYVLVRIARDVDGSLSVVSDEG